MHATLISVSEKSFTEAVAFLYIAANNPIYGSGTPCLCRRLSDNRQNLDIRAVDTQTSDALYMYSLSRNPKYFTKPLKFDPKRWYKNNKDSEVVMTPHALMPFIIGARSFIGQNIATLQMREVLRQIARNFEIQILNKHVENVFKMVLVPDEPLKISIKNL
ncbi:cytochrome P450 315a1, mitochondrial-like [Arctopsyche grandis]|uniref:cytochrome P450 315a1, mitochondrial-like n=1 Tax=Arctopsyche grandis TaxID=121162 RepID=UPI00406D7F32